MKQLSNGRRLYSPSDLVAFLECSHTSHLSIKNLSEEIRRSEPSSVAQMISLRASKHKADYLQKLKDSNKVVVEIPSTGSLSERAQLSVAEMRAGADIIYKGVLLDTSSYGVADFLVKCRQPSSLGDYSYEVLDIKLSKTARLSIMQVLLDKLFMGHNPLSILTDAIIPLCRINRIGKIWLF